jgi:Ribbon-helix-helix protein, copG family
VIRTQISMTAGQADALRRLATVRRRSQAALLRDALDELLRDDTLARRAGHARDVIGAFGSGTSDTADEHDRALTAAFDT